MAGQCAAEGVDHPQWLLRLAELELIDLPPAHGGAANPTNARFPGVKSLDTLDFPAILSV